MRAAILSLFLAQAAFGQFTLTRVTGDEERAAGAVVDLGTAYTAEQVSVRFRLRNSGPAAAAVATLSLSGVGFELSGAPKLPVGLGPHEAFDFSVVFQSTAAATYSATLETDAATVLVTATVQPGLTVSVAPAGLAFGVVEAGSSAARRVTVSNLTGLAMPMPPISASGEAYALGAAPGGGTVVQAGESAGFDVLFRPAGPGTWTGALAIGDRRYPLTGSAIGPVLPKPILTVDLAEPRSGMDGSVTVMFDVAARTAAAGTLTLAFEPLAKGATDPVIQLGVVGRSLPFTIAAGDTRLPPVNFRTGATAGTITFAVELGGAADQKTIEIPPAPVGISSTAVTRGAGTIEVRIAGFDNTRTAGKIEYTFYDSAGLPLPPVAVDNTADFARYFAGSDAGGAFALRAVFPVTGDPLQITGLEARIANSAGTAVTGRLRF